MNNYLTSPWGISYNALLLLILGLFSYNGYAKRWSAMSGKYKTTAWITWSEYGMFAKNINLSKEALVSYAYRVDGVTYNGQIRTPKIGGEDIVNKYPVGKKFEVYYSKDDPEFHQRNRPPKLVHILTKTLFLRLIIPLLYLNIPSVFVFWLVQNAR